ncbi:POT family MFS transporter [Thiolapillus brandeum]|uniref:Proton-dependent oligopeptide transporter POT family n=1 Tax=Thiolapillus brandeum TaxID=1076588 RepID=A0A7U6GH01_9GAMM|nr:POT family MFS transporter [Thiolapillus brandeum]BAO43481.1 proton-dependent oligopeptide transporter POT family [Thiolapillus brandeum]
MSYRTRPLDQKGMPGGIPYIIGNEAAERFSFYGMRTILVVFMTQYLMGAGGELATMSDEDAKGWYHLFVSAVYFTPLLGAVLADVWWGKYKTILLLSLVYCGGHLALALDDTRVGLAIGLGLIALGAGGIKPCVSAHVGDQFGHSNRGLISRSFGWFYMAINVGAFVSTLLTPWLLKHYGPHWAFGVPGVLMALATLLFWAGRNKFVHVPPAGKGFLKEALSPRSLRIFGRLGMIYVFIAVFWSLYDQTGSSWVLQAQQMDRHFLGFEMLPSQIQAVNPLLIIVLIPLFSYVIYPALGKVIKLTPMRKVALGFLLAAGAFAVSSLAQERIDAGSTPGISWQLLAYLLLTCGEVMVSITALEYSYTQAPRAMKSFIMALFMLSVSLGNIFTSLVNFFIQNDDGTVMLEGAQYYWFFTILMAVTAALFALLTPLIRDKTILQVSEGSSNAA